ncbi:MAG: bifunctional folylpolyglutamate synthase/dihydrofolate synthase [Gammaproteobacteria bacterium]
MRFNTVSEWRAFWKNSIDLGLSRIREVGDRLGVLKPNCPVITVAGTNGKGTTVFGLEAVYHQSGYKTGVFSSPYLYHFNEEIRIGASNISDKALCESFEAVNQACEQIELTIYEAKCLAALYCFQQRQVDVIILEVGLGGRLDATNVVDADVAVMTSVGLDHQEFLGHTREAIAREKMGVVRKGSVFVCGDPNPPSVIEEMTSQLKTKNYFISEEEKFPLNHFAIKKVVESLQEKLPVYQGLLGEVLERLQLPGRLETTRGDFLEIKDVAHNVDSVRVLSEYIGRQGVSGKTHAVFSMLNTKDIQSVVDIIKPSIDFWYIAPVDDDRAMQVDDIKEVLIESGVKNIATYESISEAYQSAKEAAIKNDLLLSFGSFCVLRGVSLKN